MTYATPQDVADELGRPLSGSAETTQFAGWLLRVEALILTRIPDLAARIAAGSLDQAVVVSVEAAVAARKALNPAGKQNERIDDYSYGLTDAAASVDLTLTDVEWATLLTAPERRQAFTIRPAASCW